LKAEEQVAQKFAPAPRRKWVYGFITGIVVFPAFGIAFLLRRRRLLS
jgi:hypothetical protein